MTEEDLTSENSDIATSTRLKNFNESPEAPLKPKKQRSRKKLIIIVVIIILVLGALGAAAWWWFGNHESTPQITTSEQSTKELIEKDKITDPQLARFITPTTGETWTAKKEIPDAGYITKIEGDTPTTYYEVGKRNDKTIIMAVTATIGTDIDLFERNSDGSVTYIARPNANGTYTNDSTDTINGWPKDHWSNKVVIDKTIHYDSLSLPASLQLTDTESVTAPPYITLGDFIYGSEEDTSLSVTTIRSLGQSSLVKIERKYVDTGLSAINYVVRTPIGTQINLTYQPINTTIDAYTWNNAIKTKGTIGGIVRGCGAVGTSVSRTNVLTDKDFVEAGKTDTGLPVYTLKDTTGGLAKVAYDEYVEFNSYDGAPATLSFAAFMEQHAIFAFKSASNGWLIYTIDDYAQVGGCGKPVIYLYPTATATVDVKVGAQVAISEPLYDPTNGWKHVVASPNGQLTYNGSSYSSLFWEGTGYGAYPGITTGTVVARAEAVNTIETQLAAQGLKQNEINDFVQYWQDRIPNKPFVRLAWFNTAQLNELAPLSINPRPDTIIRVFLDIKGLDQPINMPAPIFSAPTRNGFTVVEWGGLLHNKL